MQTPSSKTKLLMVRHATCEHIEDTLLGRALDAPLDERGQQQAHALAECLADEAPLRVECSPRRRTLETARAIADGAHCSLATADALDELDFGRWGGHSFAQLRHDRAWQRWNFDRGHARTPAGDSVAAVQQRVGEYLAALAQGYPNATLVLVTHAEVIRSIVLQGLGLPPREYPRVTVDPASITRLSADAGGIHVEAVNEPVRVRA